MNLFFIFIVDKGSSANKPCYLLVELHIFMGPNNVTTRSNANTNTKNAKNANNAKQALAKPKLQASSLRLTSTCCPSALLPVDDDFGANSNGLQRRALELALAVHSGSDLPRFYSVLTPGLTLSDEKYRQVESPCTTRKTGIQQKPGPATTGRL